MHSLYRFDLFHLAVTMMFYSQIITSCPKENIGINCSDIFWRSLKAKINKWDHIKSSCTVKESIDNEKIIY